MPKKTKKFSTQLVDLIACNMLQVNAQSYTQEFVDKSTPRERKAIRRDVQRVLHSLQDQIDIPGCGGTFKAAMLRGIAISLYASWNKRRVKGGFEDAGMWHSLDDQTKHAFFVFVVEVKVLADLYARCGGYGGRWMDFTSKCKFTCWPHERGFDLELQKARAEEANRRALQERSERIGRELEARRKNELADKLDSALKQQEALNRRSTEAQEALPVADPGEFADPQGVRPVWRINGAAKAAHRVLYAYEQAVLPKARHTLHETWEGCSYECRQAFRECVRGIAAGNGMHLGVFRVLHEEAKRLGFTPGPWKDGEMTSPYAHEDMSLLPLEEVAVVRIAFATILAYLDLTKPAA